MTIWASWTPSQLVPQYRAHQCIRTPQCLLPRSDRARTATLSHKSAYHPTPSHLSSVHSPGPYRAEYQYHLHHPHPSRKSVPWHNVQPEITRINPLFHLSVLGFTFKRTGHLDMPNRLFFSPSRILHFGFLHLPSIPSPLPIPHTHRLHAIPRAHPIPPLNEHTPRVRSHCAHTYSSQTTDPPSLPLLDPVPNTYSTCELFCSFLLGFFGVFCDVRRVIIRSRAPSLPLSCLSSRVFKMRSPAVHSHLPLLFYHTTFTLLLVCHTSLHTLSTPLTRRSH